MKFPKYLKVILISFLSLLLLLAITAFVIVRFYEDEVKQILVSQINKQLVTPVSVKDIELSLFKKFPNASLEFTDVTAESVQPADSLEGAERFTERLFEAHKIFLQFNILDIFHKNFTIKKIDIEEAKMNLLVTKQGNDNFHFWKKTSDTAASNFQLHLEKILVSNSDINYKNDFAKHLYSFKIRDSELNGNFSEKDYELKTQGSFFVNDIAIDSTNYLHKKEITLDGTLRVSNNKIYSIENAELKINELAFDVSGSFTAHKDKDNEIDLGIKGKNLDIETLISLLPAEYKKSMQSYSSKGLFYFDMKIRGEVGENKKPKIDASFGIKKGEIRETNSDLNLEKINLSGGYTNGKNRNDASSQLSIQDFTAHLGAGKVEGNFSLSNFHNPYLSMNAVAQLNLHQVKEFLKLDSLERFEGALNLDVSFDGNIRNIKNYTGQDFAQTKTQGDLTIQNGSIKFKGAKQQFNDLSASLLFNNNDVVVNECKGKIMDSDFDLKGFFRNAMAATFNKDEKLFIDATLDSKLINLTQILADDNTTNNAKAYELRFSDRVNFNLNANVGSLIFKKFEATNIKGTVKLQNKKMALTPVSFATMDGTVLASGIIDGTGEKDFKLICDADLRSINITKLFTEFENFGQNTLQDKNLKGDASATIQFAGEWTNELISKTESIVSNFDLTIENGALINFAPMRNLSKFIAVSELNDIRFASLKNRIEIKNRKITIPKMEINSTALNLSVSGTHTFDNIMDYHFKLLLGDLLSKKARKAKPENEEFGTIEPDGLGKTAIYISMSGSVDNPHIAYDRSGLKMQMKQNVTNETQNLKSILKGEFGWFKNDSTVKTQTQKTKKTNFDVEWDEADKKEGRKVDVNQSQLPKVKSDNAPQEEKAKIKVLDKLLHKEESKPKKKKEKEENSDDFN